MKAEVESSPDNDEQILSKTLERHFKDEIEAPPPNKPSLEELEREVKHQTEMLEEAR